jgi:Xaa-Pro dipeptidase
VQPSEQKLRRGDVIRFDVGGRYAHYRADIARMAVFGKPEARADKYYRALVAGVEAGKAIMRPGVKASQIFDLVVETVRTEGIPHYRRSHVGHGIGLDGYDAPDLTPSNADVLEEGMVVCIEAPYYEIGWCGLQIEDMVAITADGIASFMTTGSALVVLE